MLGWPLGRSSVGVISRNRLTNLSSAFWSRDRIGTDEISLFREAVRHLRLYKCHSCALCREAPCREIFIEIPSLPLVLVQTLFQLLLSKIHDHRWGSVAQPWGGHLGHLPPPKFSKHCITILHLQKLSKNKDYFMFDSWKFHILTQKVFRNAVCVRFHIVSCLSSDEEFAETLETSIINTILLSHQ